MITTEAISHQMYGVTRKQIIWNAIGIGFVIGCILSGIYYEYIIGV